jgi:hypothetical protein
LPVSAPENNIENVAKIFGKIWKNILGTEHMVLRKVRLE